MSANAPKLVADEWSELDDYANLIESMSLDPDGVNLTSGDRSLLARFAVAGAQVGFRHGGPTFVSVDRSFLRRIANNGARLGVATLAPLAVAA